MYQRTNILCHARLMVGVWGGFGKVDSPVSGNLTISV